MLCCRSCTATCTWKRFICLSFFTSWSTAAVLGQITDQRVGGLEVGGIENEAPLLAAAREARARQAGEVKRQGRGRDIERLADRAGRHALRARLHEQTEDGEPRLLSQG